MWWRPLTRAAAGLRQLATAADNRLYDRQGRLHDYLRISLTERCNLRCQYCMPAGGVPLTARSDLLTVAELLRLVAALASLGVTKLRLTGGEPTLRPDLPELVQQLKRIPGITSLGMTSNGVALRRRLEALRDCGLDRLNLSLDSLRPERYREMARRDALPRVLECMDKALETGFRPLKVNVVLMKGFNDDEILDFVELTRDREIEVRFIEYMPFSGNSWRSSRLVPYRDALRLITREYPDVQAYTPLPNSTARLWQIPGFVGRVGFIASMTQPFCGDCNRLRLTADGNLKVCLFGSSEVSLRDAVRSGATSEELTTLVRSALDKKKPQHDGMEKLAHMDNRPMVLIGG